MIHISEKKWQASIPYWTVTDIILSKYFSTETHFARISSELLLITESKNLTLKSPNNMFPQKLLLSHAKVNHEIHNKQFNSSTQIFIYCYSVHNDDIIGLIFPTLIICTWMFCCCWSCICSIVQACTCNGRF